MPVGHDEEYNSGVKHYRMFFNEELEKVREIMPSSPFDTYPIIVGK